MYAFTLTRNDERVSANRSTVEHFSTNLLTSLGSLTNIPSLTVDTLAYGMRNRVRACCLVARHGTLRENDCNKNDERTLPAKTFLKNMISCWTLRAETETKLKCFSKSRYRSDEHWQRTWALSHIKNLCSILCSQITWDEAAPPQITLQYSKLERTCAQYAAMTDRWLRCPLGLAFWNDRISIPSALFVFLTELSTCGPNVSFVSSVILRSRICSTCSNSTPSIW